jgi:uncharacterized membrane protein
MPNPHSTAKIAGHPLHPLLVPLPIGFFVGTLLCDLAYWHSPSAFWFTASEWALGAGIVAALIAALAGFIDFVGDRQIRDIGMAWFHFIGNLLAVAVEAVNWLYRFNTGSDAVLMTGLILSLVAVLMFVITGWLGGELVFKKRVGVAD